MATSRAEATPARVAAREKFNSQTKTFLRGRRNTKLTPQERYDIGARLRDGEKAIDLAVEYGVSAAYVRALGAR